MKTLMQVPVSLVLLDDTECVPALMEFGKLYYSQDYQGSNHLCLCGCNHEVYLPIKNGEWMLNNDNNKLTVSPSILQRLECKSHYIITNGTANFV